MADLKAMDIRVTMISGDARQVADAVGAELAIDEVFAIGAGTDVAIESAGVVLASSDPRGVTAVVRLSRASYREMLQNPGLGPPATT